MLEDKGAARTSAAVLAQHTYRCHPHRQKPAAKNTSFKFGHKAAQDKAFGGFQGTIPFAYSKAEFNCGKEELP